MPERDMAGPDSLSYRAIAARFIQYAEDSEALVHLTHEGFRHVRAAPQLWALLPEHDPDSPDTVQAERNAQFAQKELEEGFPRLHAHSLVGLWGALEAYIDDMVLVALVRRPELLAGMDKIKIAAPVLALGPVDQMRSVLEELKRLHGSSERQGTTRFEKLLGAVGLSGPVPSRIGDAVYEAQQIRHVWAHRGGVADERFVDRCPQLGYALNEPVNLPPAKFLPIMHGLHMYVVVVHNRVRVDDGLQPALAECPGYEGVLAELDANGQRPST